MRKRTLWALVARLSFVVLCTVTSSPSLKLLSGMKVTPWPSGCSLHLPEWWWVDDPVTLKSLSFVAPRKLIVVFGLAVVVPPMGYMATAPPDSAPLEVPPPSATASTIASATATSGTVRLGLGIMKGYERRGRDPDAAHSQGLPARARGSGNPRRAVRARPLGAQSPPHEPVAFPRTGPTRAPPPEGGGRCGGAGNRAQARSRADAGGCQRADRRGSGDRRGGPAGGRRGGLHRAARGPRPRARGLLAHARRAALAGRAGRAGHRRRRGGARAAAP